MRCLRTLAILILCLGLGACELIANFDRGKLNMSSPDGGLAVPPEPQGESDAGADEGDQDAGALSDAG